MELVDIQHVAIKTQDLEATNRFYAEVLGMSMAHRPEFDFPGSWLNIGQTMIHVMAGYAGLDTEGKSPRGSASVDHIALEAHDFDGFKIKFNEHDVEWRQFDIPDAGLWQLFVHDPNGILIELNFTVVREPEDVAGPDGTNKYIPGQF